MSGLLMMGCGGAILPAAGGGSFQDPFVIAAGVSSSADPTVLTTVAEAPAGSAIFLAVGSALNMFTGVPYDSAGGNTYDAGNTATSLGGIGTIATWHSVLTNTIPSGGTIGYNATAAGTAHITAICFPNGTTDELEQAAVSGSASSRTVSINARSDQPQAVAVLFATGSNHSTLNTPAGWGKLGASGTAAGMSWYWKRYTDTSADASSLALTFTSAAYLEFVRSVRCP